MTSIRFFQGTEVFWVLESVDTGSVVTRGRENETLKTWKFQIPLGMPPHSFQGQIIARCIISLASCLATGKGTTRSISEFQAEIRTNDHKLCVLTNHLLLKNSLALLQDNETIGGKECVGSSKKYNHLLCQRQWRQNYKIGVNTVNSWISCTGIRTSTAKAMVTTARIIHTHSNPHFWYMKFTY